QELDSLTQSLDMEEVVTPCSC
ncbi:hypothetical protein KIPB_012393, partial [Kipferlia bialata]